MPSRSKVIALSLAEVLVVAAIFSALLVSLAVVEIMARRVSLQHEHRSEVYRAAWLGVQNISAELATAVVEPVLIPADPNLAEVQYHPLLRNANGEPVFSSTSGEMVHLSETVTLTKRADGWLIRRQPSQTPSERKLAFLGTAGLCSFERMPGQCDLLKFRVLARFASAREPGQVREYQAESQLVLTNQR